MFEQLINAIPTFATVIVTLLFYFQVKKVYNSPPKWIVELRDDVFAPGGEGKPAKIQLLLQEVGIGLAQSIRNSMAGAISGDVRQAKSVQKAIGLDVLDESGIGGILDLVGMSHTKQLLAKNPQTMGLILQQVAPLIQQFQRGQGQAQSRGSSEAFRSNL